MANKLLLKRGTATNRPSITPDSGELIYTTDTKKVYVGDNTTAGGNGVLMDSEASVTSSANKIVKMDGAGKIDSGVVPSTIATVAYVDSVAAGLDFQADVLGVQTDNTLNPGTPVSGDRYIITNASSLHAGFGTISGLGNNDIVQYNGSAFVVVYDVSAKGSGALTWDRGTSSFYYYDGTSWAAFGGLTGVTAGSGLTKTGNTLDVVGTANRITVNADSIDIASTYAGQNTITTLGVVATGTWQATAIADTYIASAATWNAKLDSSSTIDGGTY